MQPGQLNNLKPINSSGYKVTPFAKVMNFVQVACCRIEASDSWYWPTWCLPLEYALMLWKLFFNVSLHLSSFFYKLPLSMISTDLHKVSNFLSEMIESEGVWLYWLIWQPIIYFYRARQSKLRWSYSIKNMKIWKKSSAAMFNLNSRRKNRRGLRKYLDIVIGMEETRVSPVSSGTYDDLAGCKLQ